MEIDIADLPEIRSSVGLCGFMELVIHHLMYVKNIYPKKAFNRSIRNGVPIWTCQNPAVKARNKEVLEEFYFELKVNDLFVESESKLVCLLDNLVSICEDIQTTNTFTDFNTIHSGEREITFELHIILSQPIELPKQEPNSWIVFPDPSESENPLKKVTPLKEESNKTYEVKAYALKN